MSFWPTPSANLTEVLVLILLTYKCLTAINSVSMSISLMFSI